MERIEAFNGVYVLVQHEGKFVKVFRTTEIVSEED